MKVLKKTLSFFLFFLALLSTIVLCACVWARNHFGNPSFEEILFTLSSPIGGTESNILLSFALEVFVSAALIVGFILYVSLTTKKIFAQYNLIATLRFLSKNTSINVAGQKIVRLVNAATTVLFITLPIIGANLVGLFSYIAKTSNHSAFIEENYVDPAQVNLVFPEEKRNLVFIYAESLESSFFSKELGGVEDKNLLEGITSLTKANVNFSNSDKFGGSQVVFGTNYTSGGLTAQMLGLPVKTSLKLFASTAIDKRFLPSAVGLGDILQANGYSQHFLIGSDKRFGNRDLLFKDHGNYEIYDYFSAIEDGRVPSDYYVWWGIEDSKLFNTAKEQLLELSQDDAPFNYTILTTNTHHFDGFQEEDCKASFADPYSNAVYCSAYQIADFIRWIQQQDFYSNTTIVLVGDHQSMNHGHFSPEVSLDERFVYNLFINAPLSAKETKNRKFLTLDIFPTTLASLGVKIEGDRLGLGTNLFSSKKTLLEEYDYSYIDAEVSKYSSFYNEKFF